VVEKTGREREGEIKTKRLQGKKVGKKQDEKQR
jgi:hypothetical protein